MASSTRASATDSRPRARPRGGRAARVWGRPRGAFGLALTVAVVLTAVLAPLLAPHDPLALAKDAVLAPPSQAYPFGTDELGRDILSRVLYGGRVSLVVAFASVLTAAVTGVAVGLVGGYFGRWWDALLMRVMDTVLAFPAVILAMAIVSLLGPSSTNAMIAVAIVSIPVFARLTRSAVLAEKEREYVEASRAIGANDLHTVVRTILPNTLTPVTVQVTVSMGYAVLLEAGLSFLGLGTQPPQPSWGAMLFQSSSYLNQAPWYGMFPGLFLTALVLGLNMISEAVQEVMSRTA
ncbi:MAG TPA: ABC transporter permease [bacterium]|nr:ABC transporter permease [bacterium]